MRLPTPLSGGLTTHGRTAIIPARRTSELHEEHEDRRWRMRLPTPLAGELITDGRTVMSHGRRNHDAHEEHEDVGECVYTHPYRGGDQRRQDSSGARKVEPRNVRRPKTASA